MTPAKVFHVIVPCVAVRSTAEYVASQKKSYLQSRLNEITGLDEIKIEKLSDERKDF